MKTVIYTSLVLLIVFTSCSIQSRKYRKGWHIESNFIRSNSAESVRSIPNQKMSSLHDDSKSSLSVKQVLKSEHKNSNEIAFNFNHNASALYKTNNTKNKTRSNNFNDGKIIHKVNQSKVKPSIQSKKEISPNQRNSIYAFLALICGLAYSGIFLLLFTLLFTLPFNVWILILVSGLMIGLYGVHLWREVKKDKSAKRYQRIIATIGLVFCFLPSVALIIGALILVVYLLFFFQINIDAI
jgi:hypothetical protein